MAATMVLVRVQPPVIVTTMHDVLVTPKIQLLCLKTGVLASKSMKQELLLLQLIVCGSVWQVQHGTTHKTQDGSNLKYM